MGVLDHAGSHPDSCALLLYLAHAHSSFSPVQVVLAGTSARCFARCTDVWPFCDNQSVRRQVPRRLRRRFHRDDGQHVLWAPPSCRPRAATAIAALSGWPLRRDHDADHQRPLPRWLLRCWGLAVSTCSGTCTAGNGPYATALLTPRKRSRTTAGLVTSVQPHRPRALLAIGGNASSTTALPARCARRRQACILGMRLAGYWCQDGSNCSTMNACAAGRLALCRA